MEHNLNNILEDLISRDYEEDWFELEIPPERHAFSACGGMSVPV